ncbi:MAG: hypothetical protein ACI8VI_001959 [Granulosicoccus sp.]|jgi:hypothetical protein
MKNEDGFTVINPTLEPVSDKVYRVANTVASIIPTGSNLFQAVFTSPIQNRTNAWMEDVEVRIMELVKQGKIDLETLSARPEFSAILLRVIQEVEISSQKEKLACLSNFVVNLASGVDVDEDELFVLTDMIKSLTPSHIKVLQLYARPSDFEDRFIEIQSFSNFVTFDEVADRELAILFYKDRSRNLIAQPRHSIPNLESSIEYWHLICAQLDTLQLLGIPCDDENIAYNLPIKGNYIKFTIRLKRTCTDIGVKILNLISEDKSTNTDNK